MATARVTNLSTRSVSALCSMAGELAIFQLVRYRLGLGKPVGDSVLEYCAYTHRGVVSSLERNLECPCDHRRFRSITTARPLLECTLRELVEEAGMGEKHDLEGISFRVGNLLFMELGSCACRKSKPLKRFYAPGESLGRCGDCGSDIRSQPFFTHHPVPASMLVTELDRPLREITAAPVGYVWVRGPELGAFVINGYQEEGPS